MMITSNLQCYPCFKLGWAVRQATWLGGSGLHSPPCAADESRATPIQSKNTIGQVGQFSLVHFAPRGSSFSSKRSWVYGQTPYSATHQKRTDVEWPICIPASSQRESRHGPSQKTQCRQWPTSPPKHQHLTKTLFIIIHYY